MRSATKDSKPGGILGFATYTTAIARLEKLKVLLDAARKRVEIQTARSSTTVKTQLGRTTRYLPQMSDEVFDSMAANIAQNDGDIPESLMTRLRFDAFKPGITDENDAQEFEAAADATRIAHLLGRAVTVQERSVAAEKKLAQAYLRRSASAPRAVLARAIADRFFDLVSKLREENSFFEDLRSQDPAIPGLLEPGQFPISLQLDSAICLWLAASLQIPEAEVQQRIAFATPSEKEISK